MKKPRIICVTGSRTIENYETICRTLDALGINKETDRIITGEAKGVDTLVKRWTYENGIRHDIHFAEWGKHGKKAGPIRNCKMIGEATEVVGIWNGISKGTRDCINQAWEMGLPTLLSVEIEKDTHETPTLWRTLS